MRAYQKNSEWDRRTRDLRTDRCLVEKALADAGVFRELMAQYRPVVVDYLELILARQKLVGAEAAAAPAADRAAGPAGRRELLAPLFVVTRFSGSVRRQPTP